MLIAAQLNFAYAVLTKYLKQRDAKGTTKFIFTVLGGSEGSRLTSLCSKLALHCSSLSEWENVVSP